MLALTKIESEVLVCEDYGNKIHELLNGLNMLECEEDEKLVIDKYYELLNKFRNIPYFSEILEFLECHNENIFWNVATVQFYNEYTLSDYKDEDDINQQIDDLAWGWIESCGYHYSDMRVKLEMLLRKYRLCTVFCVDDDVVSLDTYNPWEYMKVEFLIANCQNTLMHRIIDDDCAGFNDYLVYYNPDFKESG